LIWRARPNDSPVRVWLSSRGAPSAPAPG
jgi:hypothetical protein